MTRHPALVVLVLLQVLCAGVFLWDLIATILGLRTSPLSWQTREMLEIGAGVGLIIGLGFGAQILRRSEARASKATESLRIAQGAFQSVLEERFSDWGLTPAEQDVALFSIKGLSLSEIAAARQTSEGTVKAQTNAIYRKANVSGRTQLLSLFIEDLIEDDLV